MNLRLALPCLLVLGCATRTYRPGDGPGTYSDWQTAPGRHHVIVRNSGGSDEEGLRHVFHVHALDLCRSEGFVGYGIDTGSERMANAGKLGAPWDFSANIICIK